MIASKPDHRRHHPTFPTGSLVPDLLVVSSPTRLGVVRDVGLHPAAAFATALLQ